MTEICPTNASRLVREDDFAGLDVPLGDHEAADAAGLADAVQHIGSMICRAWLTL